MKIHHLLPLLAMFTSASAFAFANCSFQSLSEGVAPCGGAFTIPDDGGLTTTITCASTGYVIGIDCDLSVRPRKLEFSIVGPRGTKAFSKDRNALSLMEASGSSAAVGCQIR